VPREALPRPSRRWREAGPALEALIERRVRGKAVLTID
jgi:hypothetical protein